MTLITSISGIRGTIGGQKGEGLSPLDIVKFAAAYGTWLINNTNTDDYKVVIGRDARISGEMVKQLVIGTLIGMGIKVVDIDYATTPTTEIAVIEEKASGGIIITASHNPKNWNALKLLNSLGEFLTEADGKQILESAKNEDFYFAEVDKIETINNTNKYNEIHIDKILELPLVNVDAIKMANFKIVIDCVNSVGGIIIPDLLRKLGVEKIVELYCNPNGNFPHNPEPLPENIKELSNAVISHKADLGFVVDPDVDRLAIVNEDGTMFGEEYTLVSVADYVLSNQKGNTVSNLSSTRALRDITQKYGCEYSSAAVGEVNVVEKMKETNAIIGGEGNGGIIYPELHSGRDALVGIALFLSLLASKNKKCSELKKDYPEYYISKNKIQLTPNVDVDKILDSIKSNYESKNAKIITIDGVKIELDDGWIHMRKSNTEPIIRIYAESNTIEKAEFLAKNIIREINLIAR